MSAVFLAVLFVREEMLVKETLRQSAGLRPEQVQEALRGLKASAFNANLFPGIVIIYLKASLLAALTLFISTFATSNIFTIVVMVFIYFIGHLQATAREYWLQEHGAGWLAKTFLAVVALAFPDLQLFNLVDDIVAGTAIPTGLFLQTAVLGCVYTSIYLFFAWVAFHGREL
jgi:ABC-2 type transport system permease protein